MNPLRCIHSVTGERRQATQTNGKVDRDWLPTNGGVAMAVLVEGLPSKQRAALVHIKGAQYTISWPGGTDIEEDDRLTYLGKPYIVKEVLDDTTRPTGPYYTGVLARKQ